MTLAALREAIRDRLTISMGRPIGEVVVANVLALIDDFDAELARVRSLDEPRRPEPTDLIAVIGTLPKEVIWAMDKTRNWRDALFLAQQELKARTGDVPGTREARKCESCGREVTEWRVWLCEKCDDGEAPRGEPVSHGHDNSHGHGNADALRAGVDGGREPHGHGSCPTCGQDAAFEHRIEGPLHLVKTYWSGGAPRPEPPPHTETGGLNG